MLKEHEVRKIAEKLYVESQFGEWRQTREKWDSIIAERNKIDIPEYYGATDVRAVHSPEAKYAKRIILQEMGRADAVFEMHPRSVKPEARESVQNFEALMQRLWIIWNNVARPPYLLTCGDQATRGLGIYKLGLRDRQLWANRPSGEGKADKEALEELDDYKLRAGSPFVLEAVNPLTCAWFEDADGIALCVEQSARPLNPVLEAYGLAVNKEQLERLGAAQAVEGADFGKMVTFVEICTRDAIYHLLRYSKSTGNEAKYLEVWRGANPFGDVRYIFAPGIVEEADTVSERFRPLTELAIEVTELESEYATARKHQAYQAAYQMAHVIRDKDSMPLQDNDGNVVELVISPYKPLEYAMPEGFHLEVVPATNVDLDKHGAYLATWKERYGPQEVLAGGTAGEREAAWSLATRGERAEHGIRPGLDGQKHAIIQIGRMIAWCIKNYIKEPVLLWTVGSDDMGKPITEQVKVTPKDVSEPMDPDADMRYTSTAIQLTKIEALRRGKEEGDTSRLRLQTEGYGITDPVMEDRQIEQEALDEAMAAMDRYVAMRAAIGEKGEAQGEPPLSEEEDAVMQEVARRAGSKAAKERRPATPVRTTGEAPPTPERQQVM